MKFCNMPFDSVHIMPSGDVWCCGWLHLSLGNILTQEWSEIWNSQNAQLARQSILDGSFRYCNKLCCPHCNNNSLVDLDESEITSIVTEEMPTEISAAFDYICNHACPSCRGSIYKPNEEYLSERDIIIKKLSPLLNKVKMFRTNGNGDIFANRRMLDMVSSIQPEHSDFTLQIETNGTLFTPENWAKISHLGKYRIEVIITPNSYERDTFKCLSGGIDNLDKLIKNLHFVKSLRKSGEIDKVQISIVVQDRNFRELPAFVQRSLDEFEADEVIVKPIYQWFGMKEEVFWFKNIRNPLHPYHGEWLEMMTSPVLDDPRVFHWGGREATEPKEHPLSRYAVNQDVFMKLINIESFGAVLKKALGDVKRVAICIGDSVSMPDNVGRYIANVLNESAVDVCLLQRFTPCNNMVGRVPFYGFPDMDFGLVDIIVITDSFQFPKLKADIINHNFDRKIVSFSELAEGITRGNND